MCSLQVTSKVIQLYLCVCVCVYIYIYIYTHTYIYSGAQSLSLVCLFCDPMDCSPPGSSVHGISQGRVLEKIAIPFSRGYSEPGVRPGPPALVDGFYPPQSHQGTPYVCVCVCVCVCARAHACSVTSVVSQLAKNPPAIRETWVRSRGWEDPLEKGMATHSSILAWSIPWTEESGGL